MEQLVQLPDQEPLLSSGCCIELFDTHILFRCDPGVHQKEWYKWEDLGKPLGVPGEWLRVHCQERMKIAIEEIKEVWLRKEHILQAFAQLIIEAYGTDCPVVPAIIQEETDDFLEDDNMDDKLQSLYLFTDKNEDEMWLKDLERRCKTEKMFLNTADIRKNITDWTGVKWGKRTTRNGQKDYPIKGFKIVPQNEDDLLQGFQFTTNH